MPPVMPNGNAQRTRAGTWCTTADGADALKVGERAPVRTSLCGTRSLCLSTALASQAWMAMVRGIAWVRISSVGAAPSICAVVQTMMVVCKLCVHNISRSTAPAAGAKEGTSAVHRTVHKLGATARSHRSVGPRSGMKVDTIEEGQATDSGMEATADNKLSLGPRSGVKEVNRAEGGAIASVKEQDHSHGT